MAMNDVKKPRSKAHAGDYEVGYRRPPVHSRFAPGQSGNPTGRRKGVRNFATDVKDMLKAPVKVTRNGKPRNISTQQATLLRLREKGFAGDGRALERLVQLAQTYNSGEIPAVDGLAADDVAVLEVYKARLLSGATASDGADGGQTAADSSAASPPTDPVETAKAGPSKTVQPAEHSLRDDDQSADHPGSGDQRK
jgi:hypothetical protein